MKTILFLLLLSQGLCVAEDMLLLAECADSLRVCSDSNKNESALIKLQETEIDELKKESVRTLPWYVWVIIGAGSALIVNSRLK